MRSLIISVAVVGMLATAFLLYSIPPVLAVSTTTVIGWNVPSGTTFGNGLQTLIFPLIGMGLFVMFPLAFDRKGDFVVTMALLGMLVGSIFGMLTITLSGVGSTGVIPFGVLVVAAIQFVVWMWKGGGGG